MISTVVGSYPVVLVNKKSVNEKILDILGLYDPFKKSIEIAVYDQINAGIDIISDGQVRGDMVKSFAKFIPGMSVENGTTTIISKLMPPAKPMTIGDFNFTKKVMNNVLESMDISKEEKSSKGVKGIITGPNTMVYSSVLGSFYKNKNLAIIDMALALKSEAIALEKAGAKYIQIDEPFISTGVVDLKTAKEAVSIISEGLNIPLAMHVCGDLKEVFLDLLDFDIDILDCEFAGNPNNLDILEKNADKIKNKKIGLGCINTAQNSLDDFEDVSTIIKRGINAVGIENLLIDPDCGMKRIDRNIAFSKLETLVKAMKENN